MLPAANKCIGPNIFLRLINIGDAEYLTQLRTNKALSRYLSRVSGGIESQRAWIEDYKLRESAGAELYYVIESHHFGPCGFVRLYDFTHRDFRWGSWILDSSKPPKSALESAVLSFSIGFKILSKDRALIDVRKKNTKAITFYRRFGMTQTLSDEENLHFEYCRDQFDADHQNYLDVIKGV